MDEGWQLVNTIKIYNNIYVLLYMLNFFRKFYYFTINLFYLSDEEIQKINKNFDKNNLYIEYI